VRLTVKPESISVAGMQSDKKVSRMHPTL
jgi:hypothetical protein